MSAYYEDLTTIAECPSCKDKFLIRGCDGTDFVHHYAELDSPLSSGARYVYFCCGRCKEHFKEEWLFDSGYEIVDESEN